MSSITPGRDNACTSFSPYFGGILGGCVGAVFFGFSIPAIGISLVAGVIASHFLKRSQQRQENCELTWKLHQKEV